MLSIMSQNKIFFRGKPAITEVYEKKKKKKIHSTNFQFQHCFSESPSCICWRQPGKQPLS